MKRIILIAIATVGFFACKKTEQCEPFTPSAIKVEELIRNGDPGAYERIYGNSRTKPLVHIHSGAFHWPAGGNPEDGTCITANCPCMVCIEEYTQADENTPANQITSDFHRAWSSRGDAELIINDGYSTTIKDLKSLDVVFDERGNSKFTYSVIE